MNKPEINKILHESGVNTTVQEVPKTYLKSVSNPSLSIDRDNLTKGSFYVPPDPDEDISVFAEKMSKNRRHYLRALENKARDDAVKQLAAARRDMVKESVNTGSNTFIDLMRRRHTWLSNYQNYDRNFPKICKDEMCSHVCFDKSDFCINHIARDPRNKFFIECPQCHRVHPPSMPCLICGKRK